MNTILEIGIIQCLLLVVLAFQRKQKEIPNKILIFWLILYAFHLSLILLIELDYRHLLIVLLAKTLVLHHGPFLWIYTQSVFKGKVFKKDYYHFIPFIVAFIAGVFISDNTNTYWKFILLIAKISSVAGYAIFILYWVSNQVKDLKKEKADSFIHELTWIKAVAMLLLINIGLGVIHVISNVFFDQSFYAFLDILIYVAMIIVMGYFGLKQGIVYRLENQKKKEEKSYKHSPLKDEEKELLKNKIELFFEKDDDYLKSDFNLKMLSEKLVAPKHHVSQILNSEMNTSFYDLVNSKRVDHVIHLLKNNEDQKSTLEGLGYSAGFNTKSSFFYHFKKITGKTPKQFKERMSTD